MQVIINNPYRTVGLLVGATAAQQNRHIIRIPRYIDSGDAIPEEFTTYSFPALGEINLTLQNVSDASLKLDHYSDKMNAALFWFYNGNPITDDPAFEALKDGDTDTAISIWRKLAYDSAYDSYNEITKRNASAFHNLSTLYLQEYGIDGDTLHLKLLFLESNFSNELKNKATDENFKISKTELQLLFLNSLTEEKDFETSELIESISNIEFSAKEDFLKGFVQKPIEQIEMKIEEAKTKRKANKANALNIGKNLYDQISENIKQLKSILGTSNLKFSSISDKVSVEILNCGIDYFSHYKESSTDPGSASMDLFRKAKTFAIGNIVKQRCQENTDDLQEWIDNKPEREKQKLIENDLQFITSKLGIFQNLPDNIENAKDLLNSCKPRLTKIKKATSSRDELYLRISTVIAQNAQGMIVTAVNEVQERNNFEHKLNVIGEAYRLTGIISTLDLESDFKNNFKVNSEILLSIRNRHLNDMNGLLSNALIEMEKIKEWEFLRSEFDRTSQINKQQININQINKLINLIR